MLNVLYISNALSFEQSLLFFGFHVKILCTSLSPSLALSPCPLRLREIREWVLQLGPNGGCNLLQALKTTLAQMKELDALLIILGSW